MAKKTPDTKRFFTIAAEGSLEEELDKKDLSSYRPGTIDEFFIVLEEGDFLFQQAGHFLLWGRSRIASKKRKI